ncbi:putative RND superfamily exporter protein [Loktanella ponticola]|uniref:Putative RND superfamily exporter protein n=1 Tax=Yoonia ponticola TaxID=1524255 RepID=A0A7W9EYS0_9RHOB|nr:hypothetical protein [Yoonia ponticola]MBB5723113.1 putative RND superfamily exporter protein [Yoonia ponticola]
MNSQRPTGRVENFTNAFLVSFGVLVFILLWTINIVFGFLWAIGSAYACNIGLSRFTPRRE